MAVSAKTVLRTGWPPDYPLFQFPNAPLLVALGATGVARATEGDAQDYADAVASVGFAAWAYLELTDGANAFRRLLGAAGLAYVVTRLA